MASTSAETSNRVTITVTGTEIIYDDDGKEYVAVKSGNRIFKIGLLEYDFANIEVVLDKKCIPRLIEILQRIQDNG